MKSKKTRRKNEDDDYDRTPYVLNPISWGKKGQLDFLGNLQRTVSQWLISAPRSVKFLFFLVFLIFFGIVLTWVFNFIGFFCNSAGEPVKVDFNPVSTVALIFDQPSNEFINAEEVPPHNNCLYEAEYGGEYTTSSGVFVSFNESRTFYDGAERCNVCERVTLVSYNDDGKVSDRAEVCLGDATPKLPIELGFWEKTVCVEDFDKTFFLFGSCQVPTNYRYESSSFLYECVNSGACSENNVVKQWDSTLNRKGGELVYATGNPEVLDLSIDSLFFIQCNDVNRVRLTIKGIDVFDYKLWLMFVLVFVLFWAYRHFT